MLGGGIDGARGGTGKSDIDALYFKMDARGDRAPVEPNGRDLGANEGGGCGCDARGVPVTVHKREESAQAPTD